MHDYQIIMYIIFSKYALRHKNVSVSYKSIQMCIQLEVNVNSMQIFWELPRSFQLIWYESKDYLFLKFEHSEKNIYVWWELGTSENFSLCLLIMTERLINFSCLTHFKYSNNNFISSWQWDCGVHCEMDYIY